VLAEATGYSASQISPILCSPDFQAQYDVLIHESAFAARWCRVEEKREPVSDIDTS
jgi:hypothetical protein